MKNLFFFLFTFLIIISCSTLKQETQSDDDFMLESFLNNSDYELRDYFISNIQLYNGSYSANSNQENAALITVNTSNHRTMADLNYDAIKDIALLLKVNVNQQNHYYLTCKISNKVGFHPTNSIFIGQDIFIQKLFIDGETIKITYHKSKKIGNKDPISKEFKIERNRLVEIKQTLFQEDFDW